MRLPARSLLFCAAVLAGRAAEPVLTLATPGRTLAFTAAEFSALPHIELKATDPHSKAERRFSGVPVSELLARAGAPLGEKLRGAALAHVVIARARDGYAVAFALAEFDAAFSPRVILLADAEDGKPLAGGAAPLRLICPGDQKAARWARMVTTLELVSVGTAGGGEQPPTAGARHRAAAPSHP